MGELRLCDQTFLYSILTHAVNEGLYLVGLAANLFGSAGELGDHNALYTYAQLLRTGGCDQVTQWKTVSGCICILLGQGVQMDVSKAAEIFGDLSLKGHPYAQVYFLAVCDVPHLLSVFI